VPIALVALAIAAAAILRRRDAALMGYAAAALFLGGAAFCAISFALVPPVDPPAFYHQRYALPGAATMIVGVPLLLDAVLASLPQPSVRRLTAVAIALFALLLLAATPARARRLSNDARNIDDVQVAFGKALGAAPRDGSAWVVDAGASRFFGRPFVIDTIGLNTPELIGPGAQQYLDAHPPAYLDAFPGWSSVELERDGAAAVRRFVATTPYTVTSAVSMEQLVLIECRHGARGRMAVRARVFAFTCE
jgi:hypothetical protein